MRDFQTKFKKQNRRIVSTSGREPFPGGRGTQGPPQDYADGFEGPAGHPKNAGWIQTLSRNCAFINSPSGLS